jgi:hypothetical protein
VWISPPSVSLSSLYITGRETFLKLSYSHVIVLLKLSSGSPLTSEYEYSPSLGITCPSPPIWQHIFLVYLLPLPSPSFRQTRLLIVLILLVIQASQSSLSSFTVFFSLHLLLASLLPCQFSNALTIFAINFQMTPSYNLNGINNIFLFSSANWDFALLLMGPLVCQ